MKLKTLLFVALLWQWTPGQADELLLTVQRVQFLQANALLQAGDMAGYAQQRKGLESYPLYYYLEYSYLRKNFDQADAQTVNAFLTTYKNTPLGELLEVRWFEYLASKQDWHNYVRMYTPQKSVELQCYAAYARLQTGQDTEHAWAATRDLWLVGQSQPEQCDPLFALWYASPQMTPELRKNRMELALQAGNIKLAGYLAKSVADGTALAWVNQWQQADADPASLLRGMTASDTPRQRQLLAYALQRLARKDPLAAREQWEALRLRYAFSPTEQAEVARYIAMRAYRGDRADAEAWLTALSPEQRDDSVTEALFRLILKRQGWQALLDLIGQLPAAERAIPQWRYWHARALEETGQRNAAEPILRALAQERDYYGFLAADKLGLPYTFVDHPIDSPTEVQQALLDKHPGLVRAREFFFLGMSIQARREWEYTRAQLTPQEMLVAADMARDWQWFERAITTAAKAGAYDDLDLRFPLLYRHHVQSAASEQTLDTAWIYGIMRRESAFSEDVRSSAGALGLMQLLPSTAAAVAGGLDLDISAQDEDKILAVDNNIRLGSAYLKRVLDRFGNNYMLATAAYNGGPTRVSRWRGQLGCVPADLWVEYIPYRETRHYVQRVMEYTAIFDARMGNPNARMRLQAVSSDVCGATED